MKHAPRQSAAFTLIELMVTLAIISVMMFLINKLFNDSVQAVTLGTQNIDITNTIQTINEHLRDDIDAMASPQPRGVGFLIIANKKIGQMNGSTNNGVAMPSPDGSGAELQEQNLRSDQLYFIRQSDELQPLCPSGNSGFGSDSSVSAQYARVFYGHIDRTKPDGTPGGTMSDTEADQRSPNDKGWRWVLGRQALLLNGSGYSNASIPSPGVYPDSPGSGDIPQYNASTAGVDEELYMGLTDVAQAYLFSETGTTFAFFVPASVTGGSSGKTGTRVASLADTASTIRDNLMDTTFYECKQVNSNAADDNFRLKANPEPGENRSYESWRIGQMHPVLAENISEFVVQFAGDYEGTGDPDGVGDGELDRDSNDNIIWYDMDNEPPGVSNLKPTSSFSNSDNADEMYIFTPTEAQYWPWMLRIRYRIHDQTGRLNSYSNDTGGNGLDEDGDGSDNATEKGTISGRWVEVIVPVNRGS